MMSAVLQLLSTIVALLLCVATAWGVSVDHTETAATLSDSPLSAGGQRFHRIPLANTHRRHGRHRAG
ncbi:hypothetical protein [Nocardia tengchongensis]|uniref:hypothetical protein n=1 Tax=Nocardia tengchongensis TaxID=2055889 RepID=UPI00360B0A03